MNRDNNETLVLRSSIRPEMMKKALLKGTVLGVVGALCLLMGGIFIPLQYMKEWGFLLFIFSLVMITIGLLPYKRLKRLEEKPYTLTVEGLKVLHFSRGKQLLSVPLHSIDHIGYLDKINVYGICIFLKRPIVEKLSVKEGCFDLNKFLNNSLFSQAGDLFFPYFSRRSFDTLQDWLSEPE